MCTIQITRLPAGVLLALALVTAGFAQSPTNQSPDACDGKVSITRVGSLIERDIRMRAEERAEELRAKLFNLQIQEFDLQTRVDELDYRLTPVGIQRALALVPSVRPMDELRDALRIRLEGEKARVNKQLEVLASTRERLEGAIREADAELERLRQTTTWSW